MPSGASNTHSARNRMASVMRGLFDRIESANARPQCTRDRTRDGADQPALTPCGWM
jgi:hypothetical protein